MTLLTDKQHQQLLKNGEDSSKDHPPAVKLHFPGTKNIWLINSMHYPERDIAWGIYMLYGDIPIIGFVDLNELLQYRTYDGKTIEVDHQFTATHPLSVYADASIANGIIVEDKTLLDQFLP